LLRFPPSFGSSSSSPAPGAGEQETSDTIRRGAPAVQHHGLFPPGLLYGGSRFLILSNNRLTGEIPSDYGDKATSTPSTSRVTSSPVTTSSFLFGITKPAEMDLSWNELEFDLTEVRFPHHLRFLDLSHNRVSGRVAKSLMDVKLEHFNVSYNELCGEVPAGRFMSMHEADCYAHNKCLCGTPLPPCN